MSLLLKALKQAETANATKPAAGSPGALELEPLTETGIDDVSEWTAPPPLAYGGTPETPPRSPRFRLPRLSLVPLTALIAALVAAGYGMYLYFALQPPAPPPAVASTPSLPAASAPTVVVVPSPAPADLPYAESQSVAVLSDDLPPDLGDAAATASLTTDAPALPEPARRTRTPTATPASAPQFQPDVNPALLDRAYLAYQRGALNEAQALYTQAAARDGNVDALLGLAAIASLQNRDDDAQRHYRDVLDLDPRNATAQAALLDLLGTSDSQAGESRLKLLIERDPSPQLYQALGNLYADQKRWNDAQAAYFEAYRGAPDNADYAYNLAVSLDQLQQYPAALTYYERALAAGGTHRFDRTQAGTRVQQLKSLR